MVLVRGEAVYRTYLGEPKDILKRGRRIEAAKPTEISIGMRIREEKVASISNLLNAHYGNEWRSDPALYYFKDIFDNNDQNYQTVIPATATDDTELNV
nr:unnamed protein product [Callosobruchus analis]